MKKRDRAVIPDFSKKPAGKTPFKLPDVKGQASAPPSAALNRQGKPQATSAKAGGHRGK